MNIQRAVTALSLRLPTAAGRLERFDMSVPKDFPERVSGPLNRVALAAAHMVVDPLAEVDPWLQVAPDWERTIAFREHLWDLGLGVAEAMDTAQRGMGLDWPMALELIKRSVAASKHRDGAVVFSGAGTDHLDPADARTLDDVIRAYEEQVSGVEAVGGRIILMASRALARLAGTPDDYAKVYGRILGQVREPVIIHWLGDMFDPALKGYWGTADLDRAMDTAVAVINDNAAKIDGVKVSLLDKDKEIAMRRRLDARAPAAAAALSALAKDDLATFHDIFAPTVPLSRHIFRAPTRFYKTGVVFMAYLNGHQDHFTMAGGQESARSTLHLAELFRLADRAGLLRDPERAAERMRCVMAVRGVEA